MSHAVIIKNAVKKYGDFTALNGVSPVSYTHLDVYKRQDQ